MLYYIVMYRLSRNERARCIVRAGSTQEAMDIALAQFDSDWRASTTERIDDVQSFMEL